VAVHRRRWPSSPSSQAPLSVGAPEVWFDFAPYKSPQGQGRQYDVDSDGQRFLTLSVGPSSDRGAVLEPQINLLLN